jgi:hypothetical protein
VRGLVVERVSTDRASDTTTWFDERVTIVRERARIPTPAAGRDCGGCAVVSACPEHRKGAHYGRKGDLLPGILHVTPTGSTPGAGARASGAITQLFGIPASDTDPAVCTASTARRTAHDPREGSCHDVEHVGDVLVRRGLDHDDRLWGEIERHTTRCPSPTEAIGHEITRARFSSHPTAPFMATARLDALWVHDGLLDARDFKSGQVWSERVADDKQARLQAWILAPLADARGLRLRISFEHLAAEVVDDPEPFEPDADDLLAIEEDVRREVAEIRSMSEYVGIADPDVCRRCRYRSICPTPRPRSAGVADRRRRGRRMTSSTRRRHAAHACGGVHQAVRPLRERSPVPALVHDGRRLPALRSALRARAGLLGRRARHQHRHRGVVFVLAFAIGLALTAPDIPVVPLLAVLIPLMIIVPTFAYPFSKTIWVAVDRALLQHMDRNEALDEQFRGH